MGLHLDGEEQVTGFSSASIFTESAQADSLPWADIRGDGDSKFVDASVSPIQSKLNIATFEHDPEGHWDFCGYISSFSCSPSGGFWGRVGIFTTPRFTPRRFL